MAKASAPRCPPVRTLTEFEPLLPGEQQLLVGCAEGRFTILQDERPQVGTDENRVRAAFIRFLALGGDEGAYVGEGGVRLQGAFIEGDLKLEGAEILPLWLCDCWFEGKISAADARFAQFSLQGSSVGKLVAFRSSCRSGIYLRDGFEARGEVNLIGAQITGALSCVGGIFRNAGGVALDCDRAVIGGNVLLRDGFRAEGLVDFVGARVGGHLELTRASLLNEGAKAINFDSCTIEGSLFLRDIEEIRGGIDLSGARVGTLIDNKATIEKLAHLTLDGLRYERISGPCDSRTRIDWLMRQRPKDIGSSFQPQPWEQAASVLRAMGHTEDARAVAVEKQWARWRAGAIGQRPTRGVSLREAVSNRFANFFANGFHWLYGKVAGFGYRPYKVISWMLLAWLTCALLFDAGERRGLFGPTAAALQINPHLAHCGAPGDTYTPPTGMGADPVHLRNLPRPVEPWTRCSAFPASHPRFNPWIYSLDLILPVVDLRQDDAWGPIVATKGGAHPLPWGMWLQVVIWLEILIGWLGSLLLVAVLGKLVKPD